MADFETDVDSLYRTASDETGFNGALRHLQSSVNAAAFHLVAIDRPTRMPLTGLSSEFPAAHDIYCRDFAEIDPRAARFFDNDSFRAFDINAVFSEEAHRRSPVYHEFLDRYDGQIGASVIKRLDRNTTFVLGSMRPDSLGWYEDAEIAKIEYLARNLIRILSFRKAHTLDLHEMLTLDERAVILLNRYGRPLAMSEAAERLVTRSTILRASPDRIAAVERESDRRLRNAVDAVLSGAERLTDDVILRDLHGQQVCALAVRAVTSHEFLDFHSQAPSASIHIRELESGSPVRDSLLSELFGLTATEAAVASALCAGTTPLAIAAERGVAISTVRWTIRNLFEKLGASSQSELVATILRHPLMIR